MADEEKKDGIVPEKKDGENKTVRFDDAPAEPRVNPVQRPPSKFNKNAWNEPAPFVPPEETKPEKKEEKKDSQANTIKFDDAPAEPKVNPVQHAPSTFNKNAWNETPKAALSQPEELDSEPAAEAAPGEKKKKQKPPRPTTPHIDDCKSNKVTAWGAILAAFLPVAGILFCIGMLYAYKRDFMPKKFASMLRGLIIGSVIFVLYAAIIVMALILLPPPR